MDQYIGMDIATGLWSTGRPEYPEIIVTSVYMHQSNKNDSPWPEQFLSLVKHCHKNHKILVALSDSNSHSVLWGETETDDRGEAMEERQA